MRPGVAAASDLEYYVKGLQAAEGIRSQVTKDNYCTQLRRLTEILGRDVGWVLGNSRTATRDLMRAERTDGKRMTAPGAWDTLRSLVQSVLAVLKHLPGERDRWPDAHDAWSELLEKEISPLVDKKLGSNKLTERQMKGYVPWAEVVQKRDEVIRERPLSVDALLLGMYTLRPGVARADYGDLRVYRPPRDPMPKPSSDGGSVEWPNYIEWWGSEGAGDGEARIHLQEYKTAKFIGPVDDVLSPELTRVMAASMRQQPRKWLFVLPTDPEKPYSAKAFSKMACARLKALFGKPLTLQVLRHSGATALNINGMTEAERGEVARAYMHSPAMQMIYRIVEESAGPQQAEAELGRCAAACASMCPSCKMPSPAPQGRPEGEAKAKANATASAQEESAKRAGRLRESARRAAAAAADLRRRKADANASDKAKETGGARKGKAKLAGVRT
jgi:hypothetical protein